MAEHFCTEHATKFFKTPNMRSYAHPIKDKDDKTAGWCNEGDQESYHSPNPTPEDAPGKDASEDMTKKDWADKDTKTRRSIERQKALAEANAWCIAKLQAGKDIKTVELLSVAKLFESYLDNGIVVEKKK